MRVFLTGATGFIGSRVLKQLQQAGYEVVGLARSDAAARALETCGAMVHRSDLSDLDSLRVSAANADAVIHTAFDPDHSRFLASCEQDRRAIMALGEGLRDRGPLIISSSTSLGEFQLGAAASEAMFNPNQANPRKATELAAQELLDAGCDVRIVRLPQVHNSEQPGLLNGYIHWARKAGFAAWIGDGENRWAAVHVDDAARLYSLVLRQGTVGKRYHAVAEEGVVAREVIELIALRMGLPTRSIAPRDALNVFDWLSLFIGSDLPASSTITKVRLDWAPVGPTLIEDLKARDWIPEKRLMSMA